MALLKTNLKGKNKMDDLPFFKKLLNINVKCLK